MKTLKLGKDQKQWNVGLEDREKLYREWRMDLIPQTPFTKNKVSYVQNIDQFEYKIIDGKIVPVAIIELSKSEDWIRNPEAFLKTIDENKGRNQQKKVVKFIAEKLNCCAFYLEFEDNFDRFFIQEITGNSKKWHETTPEKWGKFLKKLYKEKTM